MPAREEWITPTPPRAGYLALEDDGAARDASHS